LSEIYSIMENAVAISQYELERGKPMPSLNHGSVQTNLVIELAPFRKKYRIATELSLDLDDWESVPDICIYPFIPLDTKNDVVTMMKPPLCAVEIISPSQSLTTLVAKANAYFKHGVQSCWLVLLGLDNIYVYTDPDNYDIFKANETLHDTKLDISFPLTEVFK